MPASLAVRRWLRQIGQKARLGCLCLGKFGVGTIPLCRDAFLGRRRPVAFTSGAIPLCRDAFLGRRRPVAFTSGVRPLPPREAADHGHQQCRGDGPERHSALEFKLALLGGAAVGDAPLHVRGDFGGQILRPLGQPFLRARQIEAAQQRLVRVPHMAPAPFGSLRLALEDQKLALLA